MAFHFPPTILFPRHPKETSLAVLPWSLVFLTSHSREYFDAFWHASWKHENQALLEKDIGNAKENSIDSVKFSFYRHILNSHFKEATEIQSKQHCWRKPAQYIALNQRFARSSFLFLPLSKVFALALEGGHFALMLFTALICYPWEREGTRSLCQLPSQISN